MSNVCPNNIVKLVQQSYCDIGYGLIAAFVYAAHEVIRRLVCLTKLTCLPGALIIECPLCQTTHTKIVFIVNQQFFHACTSHIDEF